MKKKIVIELIQEDCDECLYANELTPQKMGCVKFYHTVALVDGWAAELFKGCKFEITKEEEHEDNRRTN